MNTGPLFSGKGPGAGLGDWKTAFTGLCVCGIVLFMHMMRLNKKVSRVFA